MLDGGVPLATKLSQLFGVDLWSRVLAFSLTAFEELDMRDYCVDLNGELGCAQVFFQFGGFAFFGSNETSALAVTAFPNGHTSLLVFTMKTICRHGCRG